MPGPNEVSIVLTADIKDFEKAMATVAAALTKAYGEVNRTAGDLKQLSPLEDQAARATDRTALALDGAATKYRAAHEAMAVLRDVAETLPGPMGEAARAASDMANALAFGGGIGLAAASVAVLAQQYQKDMQAMSAAAAAARDKIVAPYKDLVTAIENLSKTDPVAEMAKALAVEEEAMRKWIQTTEQGKFAATEYSQARLFLKQKELDLTAAEKELVELQQQLGVSFDESVPPLTGPFASGLDKARQKVIDLRREIEILKTAQAESSIAITTNVNGGQITALQKSVAQAAVDASKKIVQIDSALSDQRTQIWANTASNIVGIQAGLTRALAGYDRSYADQMGGFAKEEVQIAEDAAHQISDGYAQAARDSIDTERGRVKSIDRVNFDEGKSLAKVDEDLKKALRRTRSGRQRRELKEDAADRKKEIQEEAAQRRQDINDQAAERQQQIAEARNVRLAEIEESKKERLADVADRRQEAAKELEVRKKDAKDAADEQIQQANRSAAQQVKAAQTRAESEKAIVRNQLDQMAADTNAKIQELGGAVNAAGLALGTSLVTSMVVALQAAQSPVTKAVQQLVDNVLASVNATGGQWVRTNADSWVWVPRYQEGGAVGRTGLAYLDAGEYVLTQDETRALTEGKTANRGSLNVTLAPTFNVNGPMDVKQERRILEQMREIIHQEIPRIFRAS